jgi:hypothetical protein
VCCCHSLVRGVCWVWLVANLLSERCLTCSSLSLPPYPFPLPFFSLLPLPQLYNDATTRPAFLQAKDMDPIIKVHHHHHHHHTTANLQLVPFQFRPLNFSVQSVLLRVALTHDEPCHAVINAQMASVGA